MNAKRGIFVAPFDELADPRLLMELSSRAEELGWDGLFLWDHIRYRAPTRDVLDRWVALSAIATATERIRIGPMVTPIARRRPHKLARETVTLDHLSRGRLTLGVGLGGDEVASLGRSARRPIRRPAPAFSTRALTSSPATGPGSSSRCRFKSRGSRCGWRAGGRTGGRCAERRGGTACFRSICRSPTRSVSSLRTCANSETIRTPRSTSWPRWMRVVTPASGTAAGATWVLTSFGQSPREGEVRAVIEDGP